MSIEPEIKVMTVAHVEAVMGIDSQVYPRPWSRAMWMEEIDDEGRTHLVVSHDLDVVGHAGSMYVLDEVHLTTVAVVPELQGQGLATALVLALLDEAVAAGVEAATLEVRTRNRRTQRLYSRFGFVPAGVRRGYYTNPVDDGIIMWLTDLRAPDSLDRFEAIRSELSSRMSTSDGAKS